jgi:hypothetical protein
MSLFRSREASGAVISDYRQLCFGSKVFKETLSAIHERADNTQITLVNSVVRFHCSQIAVVEGTHYERLSEIVQMLTHCNYIKAFATGTVIYHSSLHTGTERTYRVLLHTGFCSLNNCVSLKELGDLNFIS